jgi:predicted site-specific integrase-resolvase
MAIINKVEACKLAKITRPTLDKYIKSGKISVIKNDDKIGIDTSELFRVFPDCKSKERKINNVNIYNDVDSLHTKNNYTEQLLYEKDQRILELKDQIEQLNNINQKLIDFTMLIENKNKKRKKIWGIF